MHGVAALDAVGWQRGEGGEACGGDGAEEDICSAGGLHGGLSEVQDGADLRVLEEGGEVERHRGEDEHDERRGGGGGGGLEQGELRSREGEGVGRAHQVACAWRVHGACMACAWRVRGSCGARAGRVRGVCMACAWRVRGVCMACAWRVRGVCTARA